MADVERRERKSYKVDMLDQFIGAEIEFSTTAHEHLIGTLKNFNPLSGCYCFANLRKSDGNFWALSMMYSFRDFSGKFITAASPCPSQRTGVQDSHQNDLESNMDDVAHRVVKVEATDNGIYGLLQDTEKPEEIINPDIKDLIYESFVFEFVVDPEEYVYGWSNDVTRITSHTDSTLSEAVAFLDSRPMVGLSVLPAPIDNREEPIDFIIFGCDRGTYIFKATDRIMEKLKKVFENVDVCKVIHDSCYVSARLFFLFKIDLCNVEDTLTLDAAMLERHSRLGKSGRRFRRRDVRSYHDCVHTYLRIDLAWASRPGFYKSCGQGKLLAYELDDTGRSYARSLVLLLPELRINILQHLFFPLVLRQCAYTDAVKYSSAQEYHTLQSNNLVSPYNSIDPDDVNLDTISHSSAHLVAQMLEQKFKFFNRVRGPRAKEVGVQCDLRITQHAPASPSYRRALRALYPDPPSSRSSFSMVTSDGKSGTSSDTSDDFTVVRKIDPDLNERNNEFVDWGKVTDLLPERPKMGKVYPAGAAF